MSSMSSISETLADYINARRENERCDVTNAFRNKFPLRKPEKVIYSHTGSSFHDTSYSYYKFADELNSDMFVTMQRSDTWKDSMPYDYTFFYESSNAVYKNSSYSLEYLLKDTSMHNPSEIQRYILKRDTLKDLYKKRYELELEIAGLKRNRLNAIDAEIAAINNS